MTLMPTQCHEPFFVPDLASKEHSGTAGDSVPSPEDDSHPVARNRVPHSHCMTITLYGASGNPEYHFKSSTIWPPWHTFSCTFLKFTCFPTSFRGECARRMFIRRPLSENWISDGDGRVLQLGSSISIDCYNARRLTAYFVSFIIL